MSRSLNHKLFIIMQFTEVQRWSKEVQLLSSALRAPGSLPSFACSLTATRSQNGCLSSKHHIPFQGKKEEVEQAVPIPVLAWQRTKSFPEASIQFSLKSLLLELFHTRPPPFTGDTGQMSVCTRGTGTRFGVTHIVYHFLGLWHIACCPGKTGTQPLEGQKCLLAGWLCVCHKYAERKAQSIQ